MVLIEVLRTDCGTTAEANDPSKTRVIIFTNFRESVKDILEALKALGETVKPMEFVGQSSGKASKGQSQKVQQLVLQEFRMGVFNTIVATSIAEEGLDIMEVDLVICFDANVSPIRMIQRMGRTGRKRDGRVIVLASEGAELQGYLKKQAKSKVVGKHMHNGGVHSFNFHSSPRMIPHSFRPEAQFVELSIVKFVPRMKSKQKAAQMTDIGVTDLTAEEALILRKYIKPRDPATATWKPSLIAFPHCQLLPTQVQHVRHSERTISMLIDTLQSLHEYKTREKPGTQAQAASSGVVLREEAHCLGSPLLQEDASKVKDYSGEDFERSIGSYCGKIKPDNLEAFGPTMGTAASAGRRNNRDDDIAQEFNPHLCFEDSVASPVPSSPMPQFGEALEEVSMALHPTIPAQVTEASDACNLITAEGGCAEFTNHNPTPTPTPSAVESPPLICVDPFKVVKPTLINNSSRPMSPGAPATTNSFEPVVPFSATCGKLKSSQSSLQSCLYSKGIVSVDAMGYVCIASPPTLPLDDSFLQYLSCKCKTMCDSFSSATKLPSETDNVTEETQNIQLVVVNEPAHSGALTPGKSVNYFVASTPEEKIPNRTSENREHPHGFEDSLNDDSPRLCSLAEQGIVPSSPGVEKDSKEFDALFCHENMHTEYRENILSSTTCSLMKSEAGRSSEMADKINQVDRSRSKHYNTLLDDANITSALSAIEVSKNQKVLPMKLSTEERAAKLLAEMQTPVPQQTSSSTWNQPLDASCSVQKPKRFRRLCKAKETSKPAFQKLHASEQAGRRSVRKKVHDKAALLVDEEAEVSSDEDVSTDEDDSEDDQGSLQDFIDDKIEPTLGDSQGSDEPIDMMAVYRKSLLSQSPLDGHSLPWMRQLQEAGTPTSDDTLFPSSKCSASIVSVLSDSHGKVKSVGESVRNLIWDFHQATPAVEGNRAFADLAESPLRYQNENGLCQISAKMQSTTKAHERKRKLSFQHEILGVELEPHLSEHFDDDLFTGLDLDALEVEAVQKSRSYLQGDAPSQQGDAIFQQGAATTRQGGIASGAMQRQSSHKDVSMFNLHDQDFDFCPSFNLGIDC